MLYKEFYILICRWWGRMEKSFSSGVIWSFFSYRMISVVLYEWWTGWGILLSPIWPSALRQYFVIFPLISWSPLAQVSTFPVFLTYLSWVFILLHGTFVFIETISRSRFFVCFEHVYGYIFWSHFFYLLVCLFIWWVFIFLMSVYLLHCFFLQLYCSVLPSPPPLLLPFLLLLFLLLLPLLLFHFWIVWVPVRQEFSLWKKIVCVM